MATYNFANVMANAKKNSLELIAFKNISVTTYHVKPAAKWVPGICSWQNVRPTEHQSVKG